MICRSRNANLAGGQEIIAALYISVLGGNCWRAEEDSRDDECASHGLRLLAKRIVARELTMAATIERVRRGGEARMARLAAPRTCRDLCTIRHSFVEVGSDLVDWEIEAERVLIVKLNDRVIRSGVPR
jgi:hypothetical protein